MMNECLEQIYVQWRLTATFRRTRPNPTQQFPDQQRKADDDGRIEYADDTN